MKNKPTWSAFAPHGCPLKHQDNNSRLESAPVGMSLILQRSLRKRSAANSFCYVISWTKELKALMGGWKLRKFLIWALFLPSREKFPQLQTQAQNLLLFPRLRVVAVAGAEAGAWCATPKGFSFLILKPSVWWNDLASKENFAGKYDNTVNAEVWQSRAFHQYQTAVSDVPRVWGTGVKPALVSVRCGCCCSLASCQSLSVVTFQLSVAETEARCSPDSSRLCS